MLKSGAELLALRRYPTSSHFWYVPLACFEEIATDWYEVRIREFPPQRLCSYSHVAKELTRGIVTTLANA